ncbi:MAG: acyl-CoA dehydrogenase [Pseudomonadota bacterium]
MTVSRFQRADLCYSPSPDGTPSPANGRKTMANLVVDEHDARFVLYEQLKIEELVQAERYSEYSREMCDMFLDAAQKLAENELWPTRTIGDIEGVQLRNGSAEAPKSFHRVYRYYCEGGWMSVSAAPDHGGQGSPIALVCAAMEMFAAANLAFMTYPVLTTGAARLILNCGSVEQRRTYMDKMYAGEWGGTMCLTEPQAGSDVGALRTKAARNPDGTFSITGNKIFITSGDHDLTENIVHLVLARIEGSPPGTKGISIFIVPKKRLQDGTLADNDITTVSVEKKLGLHGSATCALNFGEKNDCIGYLLGEENGGMRIMFNMMNEARLAVGLQGLAQASGAYMHAVRYANERIQGPEFTAMRDPSAPKIPIIEHPDVRRMLLWMKSVTEGIRGLLYFAGYCHDRSVIAEDGGEVSKYTGLLELLIPICKAWSTDMGFRVVETAVQVYGGYGFCSEYPVEQFLRDIKITSIYEGTNGIQALDLIGRKLPYKQGELFRAFVAETDTALDNARKSPRLEKTADAFERARTQLVRVTTDFAVKAVSGEFLVPVLHATPYLELFGDVAVGWILLWQAEIADQRLNEIFSELDADTEEKRSEALRNNKSAAFYTGKIASAQFFANTILSLAGGKAEAILSGERSAVDIPKEAFPIR